jgi:hypothetical protein
MDKTLTLVGCEVCRRERLQDQPADLHYHCAICGEAIHTFQSSHRNGAGAWHRKCERNAGATNARLQAN